MKPAGWQQNHKLFMAFTTVRETLSFIIAVINVAVTDKANYKFLG